MQSAWQGHIEAPLSTLYVSVMTLTRLVEPLYLFVYADNVFRSAPSLLAVPLLAWLCLWAVILVLQRQYGAHAFAPATRWRHRYNYFRPIPSSAIAAAASQHDNDDDDDDTDGAPRCLICLSAVESDQMIPPCDHVFHRAVRLRHRFCCSFLTISVQCLSRWMANKLECPACRAPLPEP